mmetsp:Transcript_59790/g.177195  ORF Transcript_59790/g.177195 Transcript_59790/m.177195 type:complete len:630 (+) Transcript_59790:400-2289(+)
MLHLGSGGDDDEVKVLGLLLGNVGSLEGTLTALHGGHGNVLVEVLTREDKGSGSLLAGDRGDVGSDGLLGISRAVNVNIGEGTEGGDSLDRLVGRAILTDTDGVVGQDPGHTVELGEASNTDSGAEVVSEDKEGRSRDLEEAVVCEAVKDGSHGVLADTEVEVLSGVGLVEANTPVSALVDVVAARAVEVGGPRHVLGHELGDLLDGLVARHTGSLGTLLVGLRDGLDHLLSGHDIVIDSIIELLGELRVGLGPGLESLLPGIVGGLVLLLDTREEVAGALRHVPLLALRDANVDLGLVNVRDAGLSVSSVGALSLLHALSDDGVALDELGLAIVRRLSSGDGGSDGVEVVAVNVIDLPAVGLVTLEDVLGLSVLSHLVEGHLVGIVEDDEVVKLLVGSEGGRLGGDTLLEAAITGKGEDVVVEDLVVVSVVDGLSHLLGGGETSGVGNTSTERASGALNSGGGVLGVGELGVAGGVGVVLTEVLEVLDGEVEASKLEPGIKEHGAVARRKDEAVTVHPLGVLGIVDHLVAVKGGADLGSAEGKAHVARVSGGDGVHSKTAGLVGGGREGRLGVGIDLGGHLKGRGGNAEPGGGARRREGVDAAGSEGRGGDGEHGELHRECVGVIISV